MEQSTGKYGELYKPCGSELVIQAPKDYELDNTEMSLIIKAPQSQVPGLLRGMIVALIGFIFFARYMMPELKLLIYLLFIPMLLLFGFGIYYFFLRSYHTKGNWLVWDKETGRIDFPRIAKSDKIDHLICFQMIIDSSSGQGSHTEVNCVFKAGEHFYRYPLFLSEYYETGSYVFNLAHLFGVHVQKITYDGKKSVVSGFEFPTSDE